MRKFLNSVPLIFLPKTFILTLCTAFVLVLLSVESRSQPQIQKALKSGASGRQNLTFEITAAKDRLELPVVVLKGAKRGPVFTIIAGVHGYEYPPIVAVQELLGELAPNTLTGALVILPLANPTSFYTRTPFLNPTDRKNLNQAFPGKADGTITDAIANFITTEVIPYSDVFLDIHGGDANEDLTPFVCYYDRKDNSPKTALAEKLSLASSFENVISYPYNLSPGQPALYAFKQAVQDGKTGLSIECGKLGTVQPEAVRKIKSGVYNMLAEMKMLIQKEGKVPTPTRRFAQQSYAKAPSQGIFVSMLSAGEEVQKGQPIGKITNLFGEDLQIITAPVSGIILYKTGTPPVNQDDTLFCIAYNP